MPRSTNSVLAIGTHHNGSMSVRFRQSGLPADLVLDALKNLSWAQSVRLKRGRPGGTYLIAPIEDFGSTVEFMDKVAGVLEALNERSGGDFDAVTVKCELD